MYFCKTCGSVFDYADYRKGKYTCPNCGSQKFESANQCRVCKEYFIPKNSYDKYCDECRQAALDQLREAIDRHVDNDLIELLKDEYSDIEYIMGDEDG